MRHPTAHLLLLTSFLLTFYVPPVVPRYLHAPHRQQPLSPSTSSLFPRFRFTAKSFFYRIHSAIPPQLVPTPALISRILYTITPSPDGDTSQITPTFSISESSPSAEFQFSAESMAIHSISFDDPFPDKLTSPSVQPNYHLPPSNKVYESPARSVDDFLTPTLTFPPIIESTSPIPTFSAIPTISENIFEQATFAFSPPFASPDYELQQQTNPSESFPQVSESDASAHPKGTLFSEPSVPFFRDNPEPTQPIFAETKSSHLATPSVSDPSSPDDLIIIPSLTQMIASPPGQGEGEPENTMIIETPIYSLQPKLYPDQAYPTPTPLPAPPSIPSAPSPMVPTGIYGSFEPSYGPFVTNDANSLSLAPSPTSEQASEIYNFQPSQGLYNSHDIVSSLQPEKSLDTTWSDLSSQNPEVEMSHDPLSYSMIPSFVSNIEDSQDLTSTASPGMPEPSTVPLPTHTFEDEDLFSPQIEHSGLESVYVQPETTFMSVAEASEGVLPQTSLNILTDSPLVPSATLEQYTGPTADVSFSLATEAIPQISTYGVESATEEYYEVIESLGPFESDIPQPSFNNFMPSFEPPSVSSPGRIGKDPVQSAYVTNTQPSESEASALVSPSEFGGIDYISSSPQPETSFITETLEPLSSSNDIRPSPEDADLFSFAPAGSDSLNSPLYFTPQLDSTPSASIYDSAPFPTSLPTISFSSDDLPTLGDGPSNGVNPSSLVYSSAQPAGSYFENGAESVAVSNELSFPSNDDIQSTTEYKDEFTTSEPENSNIFPSFAVTPQIVTPSLIPDTEKSQEPSLTPGLTSVGPVLTSEPQTTKELVEPEGTASLVGPNPTSEPQATKEFMESEYTPIVVEPNPSSEPQTTKEFTESEDTTIAAEPSISSEPQTTTDALESTDSTILDEPRITSEPQTTNEPSGSEDTASSEQAETPEIYASESPFIGEDKSVPVIPTDMLDEMESIVPGQSDDVLVYPSVIISAVVTPYISQIFPEVTAIADDDIIDPSDMPSPMPTILESISPSSSTSNLDSDFSSSNPLPSEHDPLEGSNEEASIPPLEVSSSASPSISIISTFSNGSPSSTPVEIQSEISSFTSDIEASQDIEQSLPPFFPSYSSTPNPTPSDQLQVNPIPKKTPRTSPQVSKRAKGERASVSPNSGGILGDTGGNTPGGNSPPSGAGGGLPGGAGGISGIAIASFAFVLVVGVVLYKTCAVMPSGSGFMIPSIFGGPDDPSSKHGHEGESSNFGNMRTEAEWKEPWKSATELPDGIQREGQAAAALVGGEFAGTLKPGALRVRSPQVITRLAIPGMCMALSQLSSDSGKSVITVTSAGFSSGPISTERRTVTEERTDTEGSSITGKRKTTMAINFLGDADAPKVDILFVLDASGSLSWREYRQVKEMITRPDGLLDDVIRRAHDGSRIGLVEYAYDSVVVSELDRDHNLVRRRILSAFQGDANNWDEDGMYIYEVGDDVGGNALRKVSSLVGQDIGTNETESSSETGTNVDTDGGTTSDTGDSTSSEIGIQVDSQNGRESRDGGSSSNDIHEGPPKVQAREVPRAMNGQSREAHLALKWSRFEMLPPVANRKIQAKLQKVMRFRRVVLFNGGELTNGGHTDGGFEAALSEKVKMEKSGIRIITVGIGNGHEADLKKLATGKKYHIQVESAQDLDDKVNNLTEMVLQADLKHDGRFALNPPAVLRRKRQRWMNKKSSGNGRRLGTPGAPSLGSASLDPLKSISKGLPRRPSELPPWFTDPDLVS